MAKHVLTESETKKGSQMSARVRRAATKLLKKELNIKDRESWIGLAKSALGQPVVAGVLMYLTVMAIEQALPKAGTPTPPSGTTTTKPFGFDIFKSIMDILTGKGTTKDIGTVGLFGSNPLLGLSEAALASVNWDIAALKTAIILYIASGGNLAGLLTSAGGILSGPLTALVTGIKAGA